MSRMVGNLQTEMIRKEDRKVIKRRDMLDQGNNHFKKFNGTWMNSDGGLNEKFVTSLVRRNSSKRFP